MTIHASTSARDAQVAAVAALVDGGPAAGYIELRTGVQPATANDAATGTVLTTWTLQDPAFGAPASGVITLNVSGGITSTAVATGTATWARCYDSTGAVVFDGAVGTSGTEFVMADTAVSTGQTVILLSGTITAPPA